VGSAIASNFSNNAKTSIPLDQLSASKGPGAVAKAAIPCVRSDAGAMAGCAWLV